MSTAQIKKAYRSKQNKHRHHLVPIGGPSSAKEDKNSLRAVEYDSHIVSLPAVKMTGKPSIKNKLSEVRSDLYYMYILYVI
jgi:hypothetical protein